MTATSYSADLLADAVRASASRVVTSLSTDSSDRTRDDWLAMAAGCQALVNTVTAVQDVALAEASRRESVWCEDGTVGETVHARGRVTIDAADLAAPVLGASHAQAQVRIEQAVRLAAGRVPVAAGGGAPVENSGLHAIHAAMAGGRLDGYRAGVVAHELEGTPAAVADAVVAALDPHLDADAPTLRRRTRRLLARISPDLLRQRAERARSSTGLRRWVAEPGVDAWFGTFPSEDAAAAWAAVDRLAHELVSTGVCSSVEHARGKALTDLVTGNATIDVQVVLTVPETVAHAEASTASGPVADDTGDALPAVASLTVVDEAVDVAHGCGPRRASALRQPQSDDDLVEVHGARPSEPLLVPRGWLRDHLAMLLLRSRSGADGRAHLFVAPCHRLSGARLDAANDLATASYRPSAALVALVRARDGRCRFPGCAVAARFCDLDHARPWPSGLTQAANLMCLCRRHHRVKQSPGWSVRLAVDGTASWTDPAGRTRTTSALDALDALVLVPETGRSTHRSGDSAYLGGHGGDGHADPAPPWSVLETHVEVLVEHRPCHRRCTTVSALRAARTRHRIRPTAHRPPPF